jgi:hypothetical protein
MPQDHSHDRKVGTAQARTRSRAALGVAFFGLVLGLVVGLSTSAARAGDDDGSTESSWSKLMQSLGLKKSVTADTDVKYTERPPLVVPPTRDLPPPAAGPAPAPDWPKEPTVKHRKQAKGKVVVQSAAPTAADGTAANGNAAARVANPETPKKTWYNPSSWFNKEEYATFTGEPARQNLTDPPAGYRTPSPDQPYGISPDKKAKPKTAADGTKMQTGSQPGAPTGAPTSSPTGQ